MNLQDIAVHGAWRDLVTLGLQRDLERLEAQGVEFFWRSAGELPAETYLFGARLDGMLLASPDGSEMPRQAISEVILGAMTARSMFETPKAGSSRVQRR